MSEPSSKTTINVTKAGRERLRRLKDDEHFGEMLDAYRFAFALAILRGVAPTDSEGERVTVFNVGSFDPDGSIAAIVTALETDTSGSPYQTVERLAEWGLQEMEMMIDEHGSIPLQDLADALDQAES